MTLTVSREMQFTTPPVHVCVYSCAVQWNVNWSDYVIHSPLWCTRATNGALWKSAYSYPYPYPIQHIRIEVMRMMVIGQDFSIGFWYQPTFHQLNRFSWKAQRLEKNSNEFRFSAFNRASRRCMKGFRFRMQVEGCKLQAVNLKALTMNHWKCYRSEACICMCLFVSFLMRRWTHMLWRLMCEKTFPSVTIFRSNELPLITQLTHSI